ncbi:MAG TPA: FtsW/RodA/SpoVE family cell cycle protein [Candidatus Levybacteria bacterium]|nr:FtsW/RodA/SpoVE family cell cycle protein [Candidatus Levybacteria bacterium]
MQKVGVLLFLITLLLSLLGVFILYESSSYTAILNIGDRYHFVKNQLMWVGAGVIVALIISRLDYKRAYPFALPFLIGTVVLLIAVFIPGIGLELKGSNRWIDFGLFVVQPSELLKLSLTMYLAAWLSRKEENRLVAFLILFFVCVGLVAMEPDLGSALVVAIMSVTVYFLAGTKIKEMAIIAGILIIGVIGLIKFEPYRVERFMAFRNFDVNDLSTTSYHIRQVLIAVGSGGVTGVGLGNSVQKYAYVPENTTDSIFAIYAEETGFLGSLFLLAVIGAQLYLGFLISLRSSDVFGMLFGIGIVTFLCIQTFLNIGPQVVVVPLTGVPLPFVSYGGSAMIINFAAIGVLLSIARFSGKGGKRTR